MNEFRDKYKEDKRLAKEKAKREKTIEKARLRQQEKIRLAIEKSKEDIITRNEKQLARFEKKQRTQAEKKARQILGKKQTKKTAQKASDSVAYWRNKAYREFQLYARISRANNDGIVTCGDCEGVHYKQTQGGHVYSKHNFPQIAFYLLNCRPITARENKRQGDSVADRQDSVLSKEAQAALTVLTKYATHEYKAGFKTKEYYKEQYEKYKSLNKIELARLENGQ